MLKNVQGILPKKFYILLKDKTKQPIKVNEVYDTYLLHKNSYEKFLSNDIKKTYPEKCSYCNFCDWSEQCKNDWIKKRDVNQVLGNSRKDCQKFRKSGIKTYDAIAELDPKKSIQNFIMIQNKLSEADINNIQTYDLRNLKKTILVNIND